MFTVYLELGFRHLTDISAYDHFLFLFGLCVAYTFAEWRRVFWLATAFTLGHSLTLAMSVLGFIAPAQNWIEFFVALTIMLSALLNWRHQPGPDHRNKDIWSLYALALFFGLIHGMAFSNFLQASLMPGEEDRLVMQLLAFNLGVELGQLICLLGILSLNAIMLRLFKVQAREWILFGSGIVFGLGLLMALERISLL